MSAANLGAARQSNGNGSSLYLTKVSKSAIFDGDLKFNFSAEIIRKWKGGCAMRNELSTKPAYFASFLEVIPD